MSIWSPSGWFLKAKRAFPKSKAFQSLFHIKAFATQRLNQSTDVKNLNKALRVIDLVAPKTTQFENQQIHLQLIKDFLETRSKHLTEKQSSDKVAFRSQNPYELKVSSISFKEDPISRSIELHREGLKIDCAMLSYGLSTCGFKGNLHCGIQLQCLAIKNGFSVNVYVGSSLISMYSKCGDLSSASMVFEEMPLRNVVSWTALISGLAQEYQVDVCLKLYCQMRNSGIQPNDYTLTSLLSACVGSGSLGHGRRGHCHAILLGFDSYIHVANALVSMYSKCGDVEDAFGVFEMMHNKDVVSWNSMIAGYALHGLAWKAISLFEEMKWKKIKPDGITFLGVLSSCRHVGLVNEGHMYFTSMVENGVEPDLGHYSCIVDLLGRAGLVEESRKFILDMPIQPNAIIWGSLLSSCRLHNNVWIGIEAAENRLALEPSCTATHVQLAKLYARVGLWDRVAEVWKMMNDTEMRTEPGYSWIEIGNKVHRFRADDTSNSRMNEVILILDSLMCELTPDHVPEMLEEIDHAMFSIVP